MLHSRQYTPPAVRSLLDHLDAALAACDALIRAQAQADPHNLLRLELTAIAHVLQAREDMRELRLPGGAVASQVALFLTVTECLEEASPPDATSWPLEGAATRLIGGRIPVETLAALTAAMRDVIDLCSATFDDETARTRHHNPAALNEALVWATGPEV